MVGEDESARPRSTPGLLHQNSSTSLEPLIAQNAGANPSLSLPFVKGKKTLFYNLG